MARRPYTAASSVRHALVSYMAYPAQLHVALDDTQDLFVSDLDGRARDVLRKTVMPAMVVSLPSSRGRSGVALHTYALEKQYPLGAALYCGCMAYML